MSGLSHKSWWVVGLVASLAIVVVAVVHAAIPDASGVIHACYRANGNLRLVALAIRGVPGGHGNVPWQKD